MFVCDVILNLGLIPSSNLDLTAADNNNNNSTGGSDKNGVSRVEEYDVVIPDPPSLVIDFGTRFE